MVVCPTAAAVAVALFQRQTKRYMTTVGDDDDVDDAFIVAWLITEIVNVCSYATTEILIALL